MRSVIRRGERMSGRSNEFSETANDARNRETDSSMVTKYLDARASVISAVGDFEGSA